MLFLDLGRRRDDVFERRPGLQRAFLPSVAVFLAAVLALTVWAVAPGGGGGTEHLAVNEGGPSAGGLDAAPGSAEPTPPGAEVPPPAAHSGTVPRVARADTAGPFPSGIAAGTMTEVRTWEQFSGRNVDVVVTYADRSSWRTIINPWMGSDVEHFKGFDGDWVISQPLFPEKGPEKGNLADCAAGKYNSKWRAFGTWLVQHGRGDSFVRLGWEFNGLWFAWAATNTEQWISCFRNSVSSIRETSPGVRIDWCMNAHGSTTPASAFALYPGDEYVDVVGIDSYDQYPPSPDTASFARQCTGPEGLCRVVAFARSHNKLFSVPEWGLVGQNGTRAGQVGQAGGDNPVYIREMHRIFMQNVDILAYEAYFSDDVPGNVHSSLVNPTRHPRSATTYQQLW